MRGAASDCGGVSRLAALLCTALLVTGALATLPGALALRDQADDGAASPQAAQPRSEADTRGRTRATPTTPRQDARAKRARRSEALAL